MLQPFIYRLLMVAFMLQQQDCVLEKRPPVLKSLKYLLFGYSQKKFCKPLYLGNSFFIFLQVPLKVTTILICPVSVSGSFSQRRNALSLIDPLTGRSQASLRHCMIMSWILNLCNKLQSSVPTSLAIPKLKLFQEASKSMDLVSPLPSLFLSLLRLKKGRIISTEFQL